MKRKKRKPFSNDAKHGIAWGSLFFEQKDLLWDEA